jgi:hypothetical protein
MGSRLKLFVVERALTSASANGLYPKVVARPQATPHPSRASNADAEQSEHLVPIFFVDLHNLTEVRHLVFPVDTAQRQTGRLVAWHRIR